MSDRFDEMDRIQNTEEEKTENQPIAEEKPAAPVEEPAKEPEAAPTYSYEYKAEAPAAEKTAQAAEAAGENAAKQAPSAAEGQSQPPVSGAAPNPAANNGWTANGYASSYRPQVPPYPGNYSYYRQPNSAQGYYPQGGYNGYPQGAQNGGWQTPPQTPPQTQQPPQQTQWTFHDYGPIGQTPPKEKKVKTPKEKKPRSANFGLKVFAVVMSILFVLTTVGFSGYIAYDLNRDVPVQMPQENQMPGENNPQGPARDPSSFGTALPSDSEALTGNQIYTMVEPAVVGVVGYQNTMFGYQATSQGSGIIFDESGYIVTNAHVITDEMTQRVYEQVEVILSTGDSYIAKVIGADSETDLAVLKIEATGLKAAVFGDSDKALVGDPVFVIGNPNGLQFAGSLTGGFISAVDRELQVESMTKSAKYIQTDAAINPGNSGGALVDAYGQVIGITSAKLVDTDLEGMGFAIPINDAKPIIDSLIANGYVSGRVKLGITYQPMSEAISELNGLPRGIRVISVEEDSDAAAKGLQSGDIITRMDGQEVYDSDTVSKALEGKKPGDTMELTVYRIDYQSGRASTITIRAVLSERRE